MPCVTPLMVGTRRRHLSRCQPCSEEPAWSWDEQHLLSRGTLGLGERDDVVVKQVEGPTRCSLLFLPTWGGSSLGHAVMSQIQLAVTCGKDLVKRMGMEHGVSAVHVAVPCPPPAARTFPACSCLKLRQLPSCI